MGRPVLDELLALCERDDLDLCKVDDFDLFEAGDRLARGVVTALQFLTGLGGITVTSP